MSNLNVYSIQNTEYSGGSRSNKNHLEEYKTMKARGIIVVDYIFDGYKQAAHEEERLEKLLQTIVKDNATVVDYQMDLKERRGDAAPDIKKMKFRNN